MKSIRAKIRADCDCSEILSAVSRSVELLSSGSLGELAVGEKGSGALCLSSARGRRDFFGVVGMRDRTLLLGEREGVDKMYKTWASPVICVWRAVIE